MTKKCANPACPRGGQFEAPISEHWPLRSTALYCGERCRLAVANTARAAKRLRLGMKPRRRAGA